MLNSHRKAALTLEAGELFAEAARLAIDAKLEPVLAIRVLFKAGELDAALALAKRDGCFDQLAEDNRLKDGRYHAFVAPARARWLAGGGPSARRRRQHQPGT